MSDSPFWNEDWMRTQQKYWEQWGDMTRQAMGMQQPPKSPWENAMDHWWQAISPNAPDATRGFMEKMMDQGKFFYRMSEEMTRNLSQAKDWSTALNSTFEDLQKQFTANAEKGTSAAEEGFSKMMGFWEGPMDQWQKFAGDIPMHMQGFGSGNLFEQVLNMPGLGFAREDEERYKALMQAGLDYQKAFNEYNNFFSDMGKAAVDRMQVKVKKLSESGKTIDTGRGLYDLWVGACEDVYAERAITPEYSKLHGGLVNALMQVKNLWAEIMDKRLAALNMPTKQEVRTLQARLQESRRETKALRRELDALKEAVAAIAPTAEAAPARKKTTKKAASKKAAAKKTTAAKSSDA